MSPVPPVLFLERPRDETDIWDDHRFRARLLRALRKFNVA